MASGCRVIGGVAGGMRLEVPRGDATRPLSDRVKQSLFGALEAGGALDGAFLDLFAGSGAGGIEALSRGARAATFVERDRPTCAVIQANLGRVGLAGEVVCGDVLAYLAGQPGADAPYGACLVDPPYAGDDLGPALELLGADHSWLTQGAVVVAKHFWRDEQAQQVGHLVRERQRRFGETMLTFYTQRQ